MALIWQPDFCPPGDFCSMEVAPDWKTVRGFLRICNHHKKVKEEHSLTDQGLFEAIIQSSRSKEAAREEIRKQHGLPDTHQIPYVVEDDGGITITAPTDPGKDKMEIRSKANAAAAKVPRPLGTSKVQVF